MAYNNDKYNDNEIKDKFLIMLHYTQMNLINQMGDSNMPREIKIGYTNIRNFVNYFILDIEDDFEDYDEGMKDNFYLKIRDIFDFGSDYVHQGESEKMMRYLMDAYDEFWCDEE